MDNSMVTNGALALWTKKNPEAELRKIGFRKTGEVELHMENICLVVNLGKSTLSFGMISAIEEEDIKFKFFEEIGETEASLMEVRIPKDEIMVLLISDQPPTANNE